MTPREKIAKALTGEYGPGNHYATGPHFPNEEPPNHIFNDGTMPPRDRNLTGAAGAGVAVPLAASLFGGPPAAAAMLGTVPAFMGGEAIADALVRQPQRDAYNNEYSGGEEAGHELTPEEIALMRRQQR